MTATADPPGTEGAARSRRVHRAWTVAGVTFVALVAASAFRSSTGVLLEPIETEFGWSRADTAGAVSLNLVVYGLTAPFAAALMERFGIRRVVAAALTLIAAGAAGTLVMTDVWQLFVLWGLVVGVGTGSMALVFGAVVANRWFVARRGLITGIFSAASATGQLAFLPLIALLVTHRGWRTAAALTAVLALAIVPFVLALLLDRPSDRDLRPYGAPADTDVDAEPAAAPVVPTRSATGIALLELARSMRSRTFWVLVGTFFVCGWSTNGLVGTHFVAAAHDHGMPPTTAASLLALIGVFDIVGTVGSGWLSDRIDPRLLLLVYYGLRGLSLLAVPAVLGPAADPPLLFFVVFYGLDWVATVPPTVALCRQLVGVERAGVLFGWVFAAHMIGAGIAAAFAGVVRDSTGSYAAAWWTAGALCLTAALAIMTIAPARSAVASVPATA
jgi:MFS family permease